MFHMKEIGRNIADLRRAHNMTQMELADKMGISFQAVSNWERGNSMPDISKLPELAEVFGVTIDHLLGQPAKILESAAKGEIKTYLENNDVSAEEIRKIAPILKPDQVDTIVEHSNKIDLREIEDLLPFLGRDVINKLTLKLAESGDYKDLDLIIPFAEKDIIHQVARKMIADDKGIEDIAPFLGKDMIGECAMTLYQTSGLDAVEDLMPFLPSDISTQIVETEFVRNGLRNLDTIAPFLNCSYLNDLAKRAIQRDGIQAIRNIAPFLDKNVLAEYIKETYF